MFDAPWHYVVLIVVAFLLFFGWKNLPDMARSLGRSLRVFKTEIKGMGEDDKAREAAKAETPALEPPRISVQKPTAEAPGPRPRPAPSPNGRADAPAKTE
jgi:sec-independent protein translocase protein TatA